MNRHTLLFASILLVVTQAIFATAIPATRSEYKGYSWPVAPGCTQRAKTYPNFANEVRLRPDGTKRPHLGVDIIPPDDDPNIYVAKNGTVTVSSKARGSGWGNYAVVRHGDGLRTLYAHLASPSSLQVGDAVLKGDVVGTAGQTETFFVHTHFEVQQHSRAKDWTKGRIDPAFVVGPLHGCRNSAAAKKA